MQLSNNKEQRYQVKV